MSRPPAAPPRHTATRWVGRLLLALGGTAMGGIGAEILARVAEPDGHADLLFNASDAHPQGMYQHHPTLVVQPTPGFEGAVGSLGYRVPLRINSLGFRGPEPGPDAGDERWLTVGDSFTMAVQVTEAQSFSGRLDADERRTVFNGGVDGFTTAQSHERYLRLDAALDVDGVIHTFFLGNDFDEQEDLHIHRRDAARYPEGAPFERTPAPLAQRVLMQASHVYARYLVWQRQRWLEQGRDPSYTRWRDELRIFTSGGAARLGGLIRGMQSPTRDFVRDVQQRGDRLVVALAPPAFVVHPERVGPTFAVMGLDPADQALDAPRDAVAAMYAALGVRVCDLTPALRDAAGAGQTLYFAYDGHWNPAGHKVVAEALRVCLGA